MQQPELTPIRAGMGWRLPALGVIAVLVALIVVTRHDAKPAPPPGEPGASVPALAAPATLPPLETTPSPTYPDGIPREIADELVFRVDDALGLWSRGIHGEPILIGGWHKSKSCRGLDRVCPVQTLADTDLNIVGDLSTVWIALDRSIGGGSGARVLRATVEEDPDCAIRSAAQCQPRLRVLNVVWRDTGGRGSVAELI
jgi:hypothetical protein